MKLDFKIIESITMGAVKVEKKGDGIIFHRFTDEQEKLYKRVSIEQSRGFYDRCTASAGIKLHFKTDSRSLKMRVEVLRCTSRSYFSFDFFVNGRFVDALDNFLGVELPRNYTEVNLEVGEFEKEVELGGGVKEVEIYFPWSVCPRLKELSLEDGSFTEAVKKPKKLLAFGDSITQGYDALRPSVRYAARLANMLSAEETNKGIGGEVFFPELAETKEDFSPDYVTVAYGTNDWSKKSEDDFFVRCKAFYRALSKNYPNSKIFAITPIWRKDYKGERLFGEFELVEADIRKAVAGLENVSVISGFDLVPQNDSFFSDLRLHPNDGGFEHYANNLYKKIKEN